MTNLEPIKALNMDASEQQRFVRYFRGLPEKSGSTIRIFRHGEFYSVHDEDALYAADNIPNANVIKFMGEIPKLKYVTMNRNIFERFLRDLLLVKQYRVELYVKPGQSKNWNLEFKGSPGNLEQFTDILFENGNIVVNTTVVGVKIIKGYVLAVASVNAIEGTMQLLEFPDNEFFTELEGMLAQISPKECVMPSGETPELSNLKKVLERSGVLVVRSKKSEFSSDDIAQDLNRLLFFADDQQRNAMTLPETSNAEALGSLQAVIKYLDLVGSDLHFNQFKLSTLDMGLFVRLDFAALNALDCIQKPGVQSGDTIYSLLNLCSTAQGKRLLDRWIKQPICDLNLLNERLEVVDTLVKDTETRNTLKYALNKIPDILLLTKKLTSKRGSLQDCYRIYSAVDNVPALTSVLKKTDVPSVKSLLVNPISDFLVDLDKYQSMIEQTIDLDAAENDEYIVKPTLDSDLNELYKQKEAFQEKLQKVLRHAANDLGFEADKTIKLESTEQHGYFLRVTLQKEHIIRKNKNYQYIDAIKGGVRFKTEKLTDLNESMSSIREAYERMQKSIVKEVLEVAAGYSDALKNLNLCIATVDVLVAFAQAAVNAPIPYVRPKLLPKEAGVLKMKKARHPCLEKQDDVNFIPNDVEFDKTNKTLYIITGPNMGGKSTYMRTIATNVLLAHIGSFVACDEAEMSLVDCILARVGADDCDLKGMSTFMVEMVETCGITRSATANSFVIIDELGRGTSTYDGCGIAWAVAEFLAKEIKAFTLFATHFHQVTSLERDLSTVGNVHVSALISDDSITPLYQIKSGVVDNSYGIHCARMAGMSDDVIEHAKHIQNTLENSEGVKYVKALDTSTKKEIIQEGECIIATALKSFETIDLDNLNEAELLEKVAKLKADLASKNNLYVNGLLEA